MLLRALQRPLPRITYQVIGGTILFPSFYLESLESLHFFFFLWSFVRVLPWRGSVQQLAQQKGLGAPGVASALKIRVFRAADFFRYVDTSSARRDIGTLPGLPFRRSNVSGILIHEAQTMDQDGLDDGRPSFTTLPSPLSYKENTVCGVWKKRKQDGC